MNHEIADKEALFLWRLAVAGGSDWLKEVKPDIKKAARTQLIAAGMIEEQKQKKASGRGQATQLALTDQGWAWLAEHLDKRLSSRSPAGTEILCRLLTRLKTYLVQNQISLGELVSCSESTAPPSRNDVAQRIFRSYFEISHGQPNVRVKIADLRQTLPDVSRATMDRVLLEMSADGQAVLYRLDNPSEITEHDRQAVLRTASGEDRHVVYIGGDRERA